MIVAGQRRVFRVANVNTASKKKLKGLESSNEIKIDWMKDLQEVLSRVSLSSKMSKFDLQFNWKIKSRMTSWF